MDRASILTAKGPIAPIATLQRGEIVMVGGSPPASSPPPGSPDIDTGVDKLQELLEGRARDILAGQVVAHIAEHPDLARDLLEALGRVELDDQAVNLGRVKLELYKGLVGLVEDLRLVAAAHLEAHKPAPVVEDAGDKEAL